jgi:hypothetical protein
MRAIKVIIASSFIVFLFLPLSQCQSIIHQPVNEGSVELIELVESEPNILILKEEFKDELGPGLLILFTFLLPLITSILNPKSKKISFLNNLIQILSALWLSYLVYIFVYDIYSPLIAGHVLFVLVIVFVILSFISFIKIINNVKYKKIEALSD